MNTGKLTIRPIKERRFAQVPVDKIVVVNSRQRDQVRFQESIRSISELGLYKPICVNERKLKKTGKYELVYGEGRLEAYRQLGMTYIDAEIINADDVLALQSGLAENITRSPKSVIDFARRILQMYERGMSYSELARITGKSTTTMSSYIAMMQKGEERLIRGVEEGRFSLSFAMKVVESSQSEIQHFLMDSYLNGEITQKDLDCITKILKEREGKGLSNDGMTMKKLKGEVKVKIKECKMLYEQGKVKQNDVLLLNTCLRELWEDAKFNQLLTTLKDLKKPELKGKY